MNAAQIIRDAVNQVTVLRRESDSSPALRTAITEVKRFQASRFAQTYADVLSAGPYTTAVRFFLDELYSDKDYTLRDAQFSRIAGALQRFFPQQVVAAAVSLAQLHALTEALDHAMGLAWLNAEKTHRMNSARRYAVAWRAVGRRECRDSQLSTVLAVGHELDRLTRMPGLRLMLKMMRRPAQAAGLSSLQSFLEAGFDTFANMGDDGNGANEFLSMIRLRESELIEVLFSCEDVAFETALNTS